MPRERAYIAIDLKSFYASVECVDRGLDPLNTNLVVADQSRTSKTICLAVSPPLKAWGIPGRPRLFEVEQKVREVNAVRMRKAPGHAFLGESCLDSELKADPALRLDYITAMPRMARYLSVSTKIYSIYLRHVAPEDILVYSIDEVFIDVTGYLDRLRLTAREMTVLLLKEVLRETGITATAGIGTNLYLAKVAMDIVAKHSDPDENGARMAELNERTYRERLWTHRPLTDFWRVGAGTADRLQKAGMHTMGDVARSSLRNEDFLYKTFGVNAELLIDHAWGWEPCTMADIRVYRPSSRSLSSGQVLMEPYSFAKARIVVREMTEELALDLFAKRLVCGQLVLTIGYDVENLTRPETARHYKGPVSMDHYGRARPAHARGTGAPAVPTSMASALVKLALELYDAHVDRELTVRRITIAACKVQDEKDAAVRPRYRTLSLLADPEKEKAAAEAEKERLNRERRQQEVILDIRRKYGKNALLKGTNLEEGATARNRHEQIGGHRA